MVKTRSIFVFILKTVRKNFLSLLCEAKSLTVSENANRQALTVFGFI